MNTEKMIDISVLPEAEQDLIKALFDKCCERANQKVVEVKRKVWKPNIGEHYWYLCGNGHISTVTWCGSKIDVGRYKLGNCFRTEEEAKFAIEKQKVKTELQRFADEHNDSDQEEWDGANFHYYIGYDVIDDDLMPVPAVMLRRINEVYFSSKEIAEDAANKIGVKRIIKYLFDVDCEVDE